MKVDFIKKAHYTTWLANVVMVKKSNGKWRMCTDYTDLNNAYPRDSYPLSSIDHLVDGVADCNVKVYVNDIIVKFDSCLQHIQNLKEVFQALQDHYMRLNPDKCAFGVEGEKFLNFMLTHHDIKANLEKCTSAIVQLTPGTI